MCSRRRRINLTVLIKNTEFDSVCTSVLRSGRRGGQLEEKGI